MQSSSTFIRISVPPPFYRDIRDYKKAKVEMIQRAITNFNWRRAISDSSVNENIQFFGDNLKNIFSSYIPNRRIKIDYSEPKWMTPKIFASVKKRPKL